MTAPVVVGLDLSLSSTGVAILGDGEHRILTLGSKPAGDRLRDRRRRLRDRRRRLSSLTDDIWDATETLGHPALVVVEGPSYGSRTGSQHDRSGLWWLVVDMLSDVDTAPEVVEVPPACRTRYATGKGNADKDAVLAAAVRRYPWADVTGNDTADALILAAMGRRALGHPVDDPLPKTHLAAMAGVHWPEAASR